MQVLKLIALLTVLLTSYKCAVIDNKVDLFINHSGECVLPQNLLEEIQSYQPVVDKIVNEAVFGQFAGDTWKSLAKFTDAFGSRLSGTENLENSINYMIERFEEADFDNVHTENATIPHWERGNYESALLTKPRQYNLAILGLGSSIGTPRGGIMGEVIVVESFDEFDKLSRNEVQGKIVVFAPQWESYGKTVIYRRDGAAVASKKGAIAALIRSITPFSINTPHTGWQHYQNGTKKIPVASITVEDAEMLLRLYKKGEILEIHLEMEARNFEPAISRNTIGELHGSSFIFNKSVVVVSGHLDSWDVGVGAMDDGGGAFISWKAVALLKKLNLRPKRTIRVILWTGEEQGICGASSYRQQHLVNEKEEFNFFIESDMGTFEPLGLDFTGNADAECIFKEILKLMKPLNATKFDKPANGGPDIDQWLSNGFPGASLINKNEKYFWFHHSSGDSMLVENSQDLDKNTALFAAAAYVIADLSINMPNDLR